MILRFGDCELDLARQELRREGDPVRVEPQVFDLLRLFASRPGELVSSDDLVAEVWGGRIVSDSAIASRINAARRAVGDDGRSQRVIQTVQKRGFRLLPPVERVEDPGLDRPARRQSVRLTRSRDGTAIAYATTGDGPPLLRAGHFLTHLEADWQSPVWRPLLDRFGRRFSVTRYDQRGTGLSDPATDSLSLDALVDDLDAVASAAIDGPVPIFAASQGVPVAIAYAARHPGRVSRMVLYGGYAEGRSLRDSADDRERAQAILRLIRDGWGRSGGAFATAFAAIYMPDASADELQDLVRMQLASATPEGAVALRQAIDSFDVTDLLARVDVPALVLHARDDAVQPLSQARLLAAGLPRAELLILDSRNHVPLPRDPAWEQLVTAALDFLAG